MKVVEIYRKYEIPAGLQIHMLRVGAIAKIVLSNTTEELDEKSVMQACLLHDLGNIVKFTLDGKGIHVEEDLDYLKKVQAKFIKKYGVDDHEATMKILEEVGVTEKVKELVGKLGFGSDVLRQIAEEKQLEPKIVLYGDARVSPYGVLSVKERMADLERRYVGVERIHKLSREVFEATKEPVLEVARQIETIAGKDVIRLTNADLERYFEELLEYDVSVDKPTIFFQLMTDTP